MKQRMIRRFHNENGQAVVEAAFVIPLLIIILCGIIDFGWIFYNQLTVNNCSREGARYAIVNSGRADLLTVVTDEVQSVSGFDDVENLTVAIEFVDDVDIKVTVTKAVQVLTPIAGIFTENQQVLLTSSNVMRIG